MTEAFRISSRDNQHLKFARRVRDGRENDYIFIEGRRLCEEAVKSNLNVESVFCSDEFLDSGHTETFFAKHVEQKFLLSEQLLKSIADTNNPQGIVILAQRPKQPLFESLLSEATSPLPIWIFLERINNPSNLGAIMRTAEAAGVRGVIVSEGSADPFSPKSLRASMGSAFRLPVVTRSELSQVNKLAAKYGITAAAVDPAGKDIYTDADFTKPKLLVFGSEADGLPEALVDVLENSLRISIEPSVESLNLAVACGVVLFEARRQNGLSDR